MNQRNIHVQDSNTRFADADSVNVRMDFIKKMGFVKQSWASLLKEKCTAVLVLSKTANVFVKIISSIILI